MNTNTRNYQAINAYGVIGDCHSVVLVAPDGSVDWGCLPDFDSPAIFCRLLDAQRGGYFQIAPVDQNIRGTQRYLRGSNVLQTRFATETGEVILTDFMPVETLSAWQFRELNNNTWTREDGSCHCLVRIVECVQGELPISMTLKVTPDYAEAPAEVSLVPNGLGAVVSGGQQHVGLAVIGAYRLPSFTMYVQQDDGDTSPSIVMQATLQEGERLLFAVGMGRNARAARRLAEEELHMRNFDWELAHTLHCWRTWLKGSINSGPYAHWVERSALVLKMMTYAPTGAIVAAPTASLPEELGGVRNWDYRYTWLRDATFTLYALNVLGFTEEAHSFTHWLRRLSYKNGEDLQ
ncbi:MAG TPA: trehalase-like domain-containing protein, partial [Ktedonobacteraceae bacterium]|nr:trehalase-like domain-containing protein [Ktedonobacteraceae bacterium]